MDLMAERVKLQGWPKYAGGLNTQNNSTGFESYYTEFLGFNIMFHVNCMLEDDGSEQQLSRKRFIGNDLVVFIFLEGIGIFFFFFFFFKLFFITKAMNLFMLR